MSEIEKLKESFLREVVDVLANIEQTALELEREPDDVELLRQLFRDVHTLKGSAGMFNMAVAESFLHELEFMLDSFRSGRVPFSGHYVELILSAADLTRNLLFDAEPERFNSVKMDLETRIKAISGGSGFVAKAQPKKEPSAGIYTLGATCPAVADMDLFGQFLDGISSLGEATFYAPDQTIHINQVEKRCVGKWLIQLKTDMKLNELQDVLEFSEASYEAFVQEGWDASVLGADHQIIENVAAVQEEQVSTINAQTEEHKKEQKLSEIADTTVKLHVDIIDKLMAIVSELVLNRNQMLQIAQQQEIQEYQRPVQQLNNVSSG